MNDNVAAAAEYSKIEVLHQLWIKDSSFSYEKTPRPCWGICFIESGAVLYHEGERQTRAESGKAVILKAGAYYKADFLADKTRCVLINFLCNTDIVPDESGNIVVYEVGEELKSALEELDDYNIFGGRECMMKSVFYRILDGLCAKNEESFLSSQIKKIINSDTKFEISETELAERCAVSVSTAQRTFKRAYGKTMSEYRNELRIARAKTLLLSGAYSVERVAEMLNFCDSAHFSRSFKNAAGVSPKQFVKRYFNAI